MKNFKIILLLAAIIVANNINASQTRQLRLKQPATQIKAPTTTTEKKGLQQPSISEAMQTANMLYDAKSKKFIQNNITKYIQAMKSENPLYTEHELGRQVFEEILKTLKAAHGSQIDTNQLKEALSQSINNYFYAEKISLPETLSTEAKVTTEPKTPTKTTTTPTRRLLQQRGQQRAPQTIAQEKPTTPAYQPKPSTTATTTPTRTLVRRGQQAPQPTTAQKTMQEKSTEQTLPTKLEPILTGWGGKLSAEEAADMLLDKFNNLSENGVREYVKMIRAEKPDVKYSVLAGLAYENAKLILSETHTEKILTKSFTDQLIKEIDKAIKIIASDESQKLPEPIKSEKIESIKFEKLEPEKKETYSSDQAIQLLAAGSYDTFASFIDATIKNLPQAFFDNNELQRQWFHVAAKTMNRISGFTGDKLAQELILYDETLLSSIVGEVSELLKEIYARYAKEASNQYLKLF